MVFTELFELVEEVFGLEVLDDLIESSTLTDDGSYTAVGAYPSSEMVLLVQNLSRITDIPINQLLQTYGNYMFPKLMELHVELVADIANCFELFTKIDDYIHVEVKKLYPDAELPHFSCTLLDEDTLELEYNSKRPFASFAGGLVEGCAPHFDEQLLITRVPEADVSETDVTFTIKRIA